MIAKFDVESTKTVGLVNQIIAEQKTPVCDLFWNNEIMHTVRLQKLGLLEPHDWTNRCGLSTRHDCQRRELVWLRGPGTCLDRQHQFDPRPGRLPDVGR